MDWVAVVNIVLFMIIIVVTIRLLGVFFPGKRDFNMVRFLSRIAIFGAMSTILYVVPIFTITLPFFPSFLSLHFDEIPALICGFAYGPVSAFAVIGIKTVLKFVTVGTSTAGVGELGDLILSCLYVGIATFVYKKKRNLKGVAIGFGIGTLVQAIAAMVLNVYLYVPLYIKLFFRGDSGALLSVMRLAIPAIHNWWSYAFMAVLPFNILKDAIVIAVTFLIYRNIHNLLHMERKA